ncbi:MAG: glycosyltransferase [Planctomycetota bacterium]
MKVLHFNLESGWRGGEQQILYLLRGLRERDVPQELLCRKNSVLCERARADGFTVHETSPAAPLDPVVAFRLARRIRRGGFDVLHLHTAHAQGLGLLACGSLGSRRPRTVVTRRVDFSIFRHSVLGLNRLKYTRGVDRILCVSHRVRDVLLEDGIPSDLLTVVHDGVDLARIADAPDRRAAYRDAYSIPDTAPVVGNVGACVELKGQRDLVAAVPALLASHADTRVVIIGDGPLREALGEQARELGVGEHVILPGFRDDVPSWMRFFDVFCFPSRHEGLGTSVLDAMAADTPVVAARSGGLPELIRDGRDGLLVPPQDARALADALARLLTSGTEAAAMARSARERVEREFSVDRMVEGTLGAYRRVLDERVARRKP